MIKYNCNVCDRIYNEVMIHFTKDCPNNCPFCIDKRNIGVDSRKPDVKAIWNALKKCEPYIDTVTISGGEPFLYINELYELVKLIKEFTKLKLIIVTSIPKTCFDNEALFYDICSKCDNIQFSVGHYDNEKAAKLFGNNYFLTYNKQRMEMLLTFPYKDKVTVSINIVKGLLDTKDEIIRHIKAFTYWNYKDIKLAEMFDADDYYVDVTKVLGIKMKSPFAHGCKTEYDISKLIPDFNGKITIKRTCFLRTKCQEASLSDCIKMLTKYIKKKEYYFGVIHEDGTLAPYWI